MAHVFISYAREDLDFAEQLANRLNRTGLSVWWDRRLLAGDDIEAEIDEQIQSCDAVIVVWSSTSLNSHWVKSEASAALALNKLVPVRSDDTRLPRPYDQIHTLDLSNWNGGFNKDIRLLFDSVRTISKGKKIRRGPGKAVGTISKRRIFSIGAMASAGVLALAVISDVTDLVGNLGGQNDENALNEKLEQLDDRLARMDEPATIAPIAIDEIYLRESLRSLQTLDIPVDDLVIEMASQPNFDAIVQALEETLSAEKKSLTPQRERNLMHQLAALLYQTDRAKAETLYEAILDKNPNDFAANLLMSDIYANKHDPTESAKYVEVAYQLTPPNRSSALELDIAKAFNVSLEQNYTDAAEMLETIRMQAEAEGLRYQYSSATGVRAMALMMIDRHDEAQVMLADVIEMQKSENFYNHYANSLFSLAEIEHLNGNIDTASQHLERHLSIAEAIQKPGYLAQGYEMLGRLNFEAGNIENAEMHFSKGLAIGREHAFAGDIIRNAIGLAGISLERNEITSACRFYNIAENETLNVGSRSFSEVADKKAKLCGTL